MPVVTIPTGAVTLPLLATLPPTPAPTYEGAHVSWGILVSEPGFHYEGHFIEVTPEWIDWQIGEFERLTDRGYKPPARSVHQKAPLRKGHILQTIRWLDPRDQYWKMLAAIQWNFPNAAELIRTEQLYYLSPGFGPLEDERGRDFPFVIREVSAVDAPHGKSTSVHGPHVLNAEGDQPMPYIVVAPTPNPETPVTTQEIASDTDPMEAMMARMDKFEQMLAAIIEKMNAEASVPVEPEMAEEDKPEEVKMADKPSVPESVEMAELRARTAKLEKKLAESEERANRATFDASYPLGMIIDLSEKTRDAFYQLAKASPEAFEAIKGATRTAKTQPETPSEPEQSVTRHGFNWGVRMSESDPQVASPSDEDIYNQAVAESGGDHIKANKIYKQRKGLAR